jgi:hypothetical protein
MAVLMTAGSASAADRDPNAMEPALTSIVAAAPAAFVAAEIDWSLVPARVAPSNRGSLLPALYLSLATLNAYDAYSTTSALGKGAVEANPLMRGVAGNPAALWAVKGGVTAVSIYAAERLWRDNHRVAAIAVMAITNGVMAAVATQNSRVLRAHGR